MYKLSSYSLPLLLCGFLCSIPTSFAQEPSPSKSNIESKNLESKSLAVIGSGNISVPYLDQEITLDGELDDAIWQQANTVSLNLVNSPWQNLPSPINTEAKIIENGKYLYIAFIADDPEPEKIQGFLGDRDTKWSDDIVGIKLDTHNNRRLNYEFFVNPMGVQNDAIFNEITGEANDLWDGIWYSYGKITERGYQVEIAIPYNILNFEEDGKEKKWAIELLRIYPRETTLRISHTPLDRDNPCWLCQYPEAVGFANAETGNNIRLTPAVTASKNQTKDIYDPNSQWQDDNDMAAGLDLRWGIDANNSLNATINPDFSTVEADAGQLSINKTFSLFYDEKRAFFLDNSDYFKSNYDLVYTRNIVAPDYGAKFTGRAQQHSYGVFMTNDTETNFFMPGNLSSDIATLKQDSHSAALRYRYDHNEDLSLGAISTIRESDNYHNYVAGFDGKYRFNDSNAVRAQFLTSSTQYSDDLYKSFCLDSDCEDAQAQDCQFGNCGYTEQVHRSNIQGEFSDQTYKLDFNHDSEYWQAHLGHENIGKNFRADLGYMPKIDLQKSQASLSRLFYADQNSLWQEAKLSGNWHLRQNENGEFIERYFSTNFEIDGPKQLFLDITLSSADKVGLRHDDSALAIEGNTTTFTENQLNIFAEAQPHARLFFYVDLTLGDKIDYNNDRLGELTEVATNVTWHITKHLELDLSQTYSQLDADNENRQYSDNVYTANLTDLRLSYQFDVQSYIKLSMVYTNIDRNPHNNPHIAVSEKNNYLSTQLLYAYKLNPQTVFFLGYSDSSFQDDELSKLTREKRTFFTKLSYSWMP